MDTVERQFLLEALEADLRVADLPCATDDFNGGAVYGYFLWKWREHR